MTVSLKPTESSQVFKRLYTAKTTEFKELRLKNDLCRDYCKLFGIAPKKAEVGENEYKRFNFDLRNTVPLEHAKSILSLYAKHINNVELQLKQQVFDQKDIDNTPGLIRVNNRPWHWLLYNSKHKAIGNIQLDFNCFYQTGNQNTKNTLPKRILNYAATLAQDKTALKQRIVTVLLIICTGLLYHYKTRMAPSENPLVCNITINDEYTYEKHMTIWKDREQEIKQRLFWLKQGKGNDHDNNKQLIEVLELKLAGVENDLATSRNQKESYKERLAYLNERLHELENIRDQVAPDIYKQAYFALLLGNTKKAYELYQVFNDKSEQTIQRVAKANYEQGLIDMSQLAYNRAFERFERAANLQPGSIQYLHKAGHLAYTLNDFKKAISYYDQALKYIDINHNHNHQQLVQIYHELGLSWKILADFSKSVQYLESGLAYARQHLEKDNPQIASLWQSLGDVSQTLGNQLAALDYFEDSLRSNNNSHNHDSIGAAVTLQSMGLAWHDLGSLEKAHQYSHQSIRILENALSKHLNKLGDNHPEIILYRNQLGKAWIIMGNPFKAIDYIEKSLSGNIKLFGNKHLSVAQNWNNLGSAWEAAGDYSKAKKSYEKSYETFKNRLSQKHPTTQDVLSNLQRLKKIGSI